MKRLILFAIVAIISFGCTESPNGPHCTKTESDLWKETSTGLTDPDGNIYSTVTIGTQIWTVENLRTTKYNDGTVIPHVTDSVQWSDMTTPGYCFYENSTLSSENEKWGALYNWYTINTGKLAPSCWRVPTHEDWIALLHYLVANGYNYDGTTSFNKIAKAIAAKTDWQSSESNGEVGNNLNKNNASGFSALPGGIRSPERGFRFQGNNGCWWSATEAIVSKTDTLNAWFRYLSYDNTGLGILFYSKNYGLSVRLVRNIK